MSRIKNWIDSRQIESQRDNKETILECIAMIIALIMIMGCMWLFLVATSNHYY